MRASSASLPIDPSNAISSWLAASASGVAVDRSPKAAPIPAFVRQWERRKRAACTASDEGAVAHTMPPSARRAAIGAIARARSSQSAAIAGRARADSKWAKASIVAARVVCGRSPATRVDKTRTATAGSAA